MTRATPRTIAAAPTSTDAKDYVAAPSGVLSQAEFDDIGQQDNRLLRSTGDSSEALDKAVLKQVSEGPMDTDYVEMMAFLREPVEIQIAENGDERAEQVFEVNVNGDLRFFRRGEIKTVPRYIVDRLLRMLETRYRQKEVVNAEGIKDILHIPVTTLKYDFAITRDSNPLGRSWAQHVRNEIG